MLILDIKVSAQNRLLAGLLTAAEGCECGLGQKFDAACLNFVGYSTGGCGLLGGGLEV